MASATENPSKQFIESLDNLEYLAASDTYDITGKSAAQVIAILKSVVNNRKQYEYKKGRKEQVFTFNIYLVGQPKISFELKAMPSTDQPGNGVIWRKDPNDLNNRISYRYNKTLVNKLEKQYSNNTKKFAQDIKRVFKNNSELFNCGNEIIKDVYFLLLFEIGRRLVKDAPNYSLKKRNLDNLQISEAITKIVKLFEEKACGFKDVFLQNERYHCFSGEPDERREAIRALQFKEIKELFCEKEEEESSQDTTGTDNESSEGAVSEIPGNVEASDLSNLSLEESKKPSNKD